MLPRLVLAAMFAVLALITTPAAIAAPSGGNASNAKMCQKGGWESLADNSGHPFTSQGACTSYAAKGGTLLTEAQLVCLNDGWKSIGPTASAAFASEEACLVFVAGGGTAMPLSADISVTARSLSCGAGGCTYEITVRNDGPSGATVIMQDTCISGTYTSGLPSPWQQVFPEALSGFKQAFIAANSSASYPVSCSFGVGGSSQVYSSSAPDPDSTPNNTIATEDDYVAFVTYPA